MYIKVIGAALIIIGCGGFGYKVARAHMRELRTLQQLTALLDYMGCELQYRATPLPDLCRQAAGETKGILQSVFLSLSHTLEDQLLPNASECMELALNSIENIPEKTQSALEQLGSTLGRFDIDGQLKGLEAVRHSCRKTLEELEKNRDARLRGYQTLGLCAGAALVILFI